LTGEVEASAHSGANTFAFGLVRNGEDLTERFSGLTAHVETDPALTGSVRFGLGFEDYHEQWNPMTREAAVGSGLDLYRSRWDLAPEITFAVARPVTISVGTSFTETDSENTALGSRWTNAATLDVNYGHKIENGGIEQRIDGKYSLRVATRFLGSTYAYARHMISMRYEARSGRHSMVSQFIAGSIAGEAPFFDRFVLGSSSTLRGWDRYEIDPLGGSTVEAFYDTGMLWQNDRGATLRHSLGVGFRKGIFMLSMACPLRDGHVEPVFMAGMNY
jgi:hypothetical protein